MAAYLIVDLDIHDQAGFQSYRMRVSAIIAKHGGEYLVRGGQFEVIEGDWHQASRPSVAFRTSSISDCKAVPGTPMPTRLPRSWANMVIGSASL